MSWQECRGEVEGGGGHHFVLDSDVALATVVACAGDACEGCGEEWGRVEVKAKR